MKEGLEYFTDTYLTSIGLIIFFAYFVGVILWATRRSGKNLYDRMQALPLEEGEIQ